jgi:hypothetical protein
VITYGKWHIHYNPPPIPWNNFDWVYVHDDFDGAPDANDNRCGHAESLEACKREIDLIEDKLEWDNAAPMEAVS